MGRSTPEVRNLGLLVEGRSLPTPTPIAIPPAYPFVYGKTWIDGVQGRSHYITYPYPPFVWGVFVHPVDLLLVQGDRKRRWL